MAKMEVANLLFIMHSTLCCKVSINQTKEQSILDMKIAKKTSSTSISWMMLKTTDLNHILR